MSTVDGQWAKDQIQRKTQGVTPIPAGSGVVLATRTIVANSVFSWQVTITPTNKALSIWNLAYDVLIDSSTDTTFAWPWGTSVTGTMAQKIDIISWMSYIKSDDNANKRIFIVTIRNNDSVSHTTYMYWKAYTMSTSIGITS